jgi:Phage tail lysozyme
MDRESKIRLTVEDNTAKGAASAIANIKKVNDAAAKSFAPAQAANANWARSAESMARRLGTNLVDIARRQADFANQTRNSTKNLENLGTKGNQSFGLIQKGVEGGSAALMGMAGRFLGVAAAAEVARKSFLGFAATDQRMRLLQNDAGATRQQIDRTTESLKRLSMETATSMDPLIEGFNELREAGQLSLEETEKIFPKIAKAAKGSGMDVIALGRSVGDMMRNLQVPAEGVDKALEAVTFGVQDLRMNADAFSKAAPKLTEAMAEWGYKGTDGVNRMVAFMGSLQKVTGDTTKSSMVLSRLLETMASGEMSTALGFETAEGLQKHLRGAQEAGQDVLGVYVGLIAQAKDRDAVLNKIGLRERAGVRALLNDYDKMHGRINDIANSQGRAAGAFKNVMDGPQASIDKMLMSLDALSKEFGLLLHTLGVTEGIKALIKEFQDLRRLVLAIKEIWDGFKKGALPDWADDAMSDALFGKIGESSIRDSLEWMAKKMGRETRASKRARGATEEGGGGEFGARFKGYDTPLPSFPGEKEKAAEDAKALKDAMEQMTPEFQRQAEERRKENALRELGSQRLRELNDELQTTTNNIKKMSFSVDKGGDKVRVFAARLDNSAGALGGMLQNASFTTGGVGGGGGGGGNGLGGGQSAGPAGGYGGGSGYGSGSSGMGPSPNAGGGGGGGGGATSAAPSPEPGGGTVPAASGTTPADQGRTASGNDRERIAAAKTAMKDQLIRDGLSPDKAEEASNLLAGQALSESELKPTLTHDKDKQGNPTGYGIYGARLGRRDKMLAWMQKNGYAKDSLEGQSRYMAHEAMTDPEYKKSRQALENATPENRAQNTKTLIDNFERPADRGQGQINRRIGRTNQAAGVSSGKADTKVASIDPNAGGGGGGSTAAAQVLPGTVAGGGASPGQNPRDIPRHYGGTMTMEGKEYSYGTGGGGKGSTPPGSYNINMDQRLGTGGAGGRGTLGNVGKRIGSIATVGGTGGEITDPRYPGQTRAGIQIHQAMTKRLDKLYTAGCFGIEPSQWPAYKQHLIDMAKRNPGGLRLDVGKDGRAQVVVRGSPLPMPGDEKLGKTEVAQSAQGTGATTSTSTGSGTPTPQSQSGGAPAVKSGSADATKTTEPVKDDDPNKPIALAKGGTMSPGQTAIVGEEGPELFQAGTGGRVYPNSMMNVNMRVNDSHVQFARASMRRQADREVREARWNSYADIGAA